MNFNFYGLISYKYERMLAHAILHKKEEEKGSDNGKFINGAWPRNDRLGGGDRASNWFHFWFGGYSDSASVVCSLYPLLLPHMM